MTAPAPSPDPRTRVRPWAVAAGLVLAALVLVVDSPLHHQGEFGSRPARAAAVALLMAVWWLAEAVPIYWTACVPLVAFPLLGVFGRGLAGDLGAAARPFVDPYIFLFAGGMAIAAAMQQWQLHRRLALGVMSAIGTEPRRLLAGVLVATAFVSLWISNTATAAMMFPIGLALIAQLERQQGAGGVPRRLPRYGMAVMLAIAWGANLGGVGTKIGTAPNAQFAGFMERRGVEISFLEFAAVGLPFVVVMLPIAWAFLCRVAAPDQLSGDARETVRAELAQLGAIRRGETVVLAVFSVTAALWIASKPITAWLAPRVGPMVSGSFRLGSAHVEGGIAVAAALALLLLRAEGRPALAPRSLIGPPWETLLLLGGGFAMAAGIQESGLSRFLAGELATIAAFPAFAQIVLAALVTVGISAVASNTATVAVMLVVLADAASPAARDAVLFAATIAASCDFALPVGTPPNAIVFGSGYVRIPVMARYGAPLDLIAALLAALWCAVVVPLWIS